MKRLLWGCGILLLTSCASHTPSDMSETADGSDGAPYTQTASERGGNNSIWSEVFRTALQTGMGFVHH